MNDAARALQPELRVLIVDDSAFVRRTLERLITAMPGMRVVGMASDGVEAVQQVVRLRPDVVTMDVEMPRMDGVTAVAEIMQTVPTPIVMLSTLTKEGAETTIRALEAGAVECVAKPSALSHELVGISERLGQAIQNASQTRLQRRRPRPLAPAPGTSGGSRPTGVPSTGIVVIGSSTGGPPALTEVLPHLPASLATGVVVVQHMPAGFTGALARRLNSLSAIEVVEASEGDVVTAGRALVAPGDYHLEVTVERRVRLHQAAPKHGVRPAIDVTLASVARVYGRNATVAILTGMGKDGAAGAAQVEEAGGRVIVQDEATSVVYGMPRVAKELTRRAREVPLERVAEALVAAVGTR